MHLTAGYIPVFPLKQDKDPTVTVVFPDNAKIHPAMSNISLKEYTGKEGPDW